MGIHSAVIDSATDEGSVYQSSVCCSGFDISFASRSSATKKSADGNLSFMAAA
jgi:hypothetical protein